MPNWCLSQLEVEGGKSSIDDLIAHVGSASDALDFMRVSPPPSSLLERRPEDSEAGQSDSSLAGALDWLTENWGTSSNALNLRVTREADDVCVFRFDTAWAPPIPLIKKLSSEYPHLTFALTFWEPWGGYAGGAFFELGRITGLVKYERAYETPPSARATLFCAETALSGLEASIIEPFATPGEPQAPEETRAEP